MSWSRVAPVILLILGLAQMAGDLSGWGALKGVAAATQASPAPKVFSAVRGLETYSSRFFLEWTDGSGVEKSVELTKERYSRLRGPYNRRNVYGAALAYGPVLAADEKARPMLEAVLRYSLNGEAPLVRELGIEANQVRGRFRVRCEPLSEAELDDLPLVLEAPQ